jgi:hypothetical protein
MSHHRGYGEQDFGSGGINIRPTPLPPYVLLSDCQIKARRAWWRGLGIGVLIGVAVGLSLPAVVQMIVGGW